MKEQINRSISDAILAIQSMKNPNTIDFFHQVSKTIAKCFTNNNKLLVAGNGGSLCDAMHLAEEFSGFFRKKRLALAAIALADPSHISCVANDVGFEEVFSRGVEALGQPGDILIVLTTSGNSDNLIRAVETAKRKEIFVIGFLGKTGGKMQGLCDLEWIVSGFSTSDRIQEAHMTGLHIIVEMVENILFYDKTNQLSQDHHTNAVIA